MKKLKLFIFYLILFSCFGVINVNALVSGDFTYDVNSDETTVTITKYSSTGAKNVILPDTIDGKYVTIIGDNSFEDLSLTDVTLPDHLKEIGESAFSTNELTNLVIPNDVTVIGNNSFEFNKLTSITIPNGVLVIGESAFEMNQLTNVTIPKSVTEIGFCAFASQLDNMDEPLLKKVVILSKNVIIGDDDHDVFKDSATSDFKLYGYDGSTTETFANEAVFDFSSLKEITDEMINDIPTQYYNGSVLTPAIVISDGLSTLNKDTDYMVSYESNNASGMGKAIVTGLGDYFGSYIEKLFVIKKNQYLISIYPLTGATVTPNEAVKVDYDGSQYYTIKVQEGYKIISVLVNNVEELTSLENNILKIENPTADMTIVIKTENIEEIVNEDNPKTSDSIMFSIVLGCVSLFGILVVGLYVKKI